MSDKPPHILGLKPGTRQLGFCFLRGSELMDWGVKAMKGKWSRSKRKRILDLLSELFQRYDPDAVAIKRLHPSRSSAQLQGLVRDMKRLARNKKVKICQYSIGQLEEFFSPEERINRYQLAARVASRHPVLFHELRRLRASRHPYHMAMFEAVALGSVCFHQLDRV